MEKNIIGERVRKLRYSMDLTQEKLGEKAELHYSYIGQVERGDKTPSLTALMKISEALNIPLEDLIREPREDNPEVKLKLKNINNMLADRSPRELELIKNILQNILEYMDSKDHQLQS